jgi:methionyl-tRNA formyltransferase
MRRSCPAIAALPRSIAPSWPATTDGVTIMRVVQALDAGPMMAKVARAIDPQETSEDVQRDLAASGAVALLDAVDALAEGRAQEEPQREEDATYAPKIERADGIVDWLRPALAIHNQIRGLHPWPHAFAISMASG